MAIAASYERGVLSCAPKSEGDKLVESSAITSALRKALGSDVEIKDLHGNIVSVKASEAIAIATIADAIANPSTSKAKDLALILGEMKEDSGNVTFSLTDAMFEKMAIKRGDDGSVIDCTNPK